MGTPKEIKNPEARDRKEFEAIIYAFNKIGDTKNDSLRRVLNNSLFHLLAEAIKFKKSIAKPH
jgi:hypothetical protein